MNYENCIKRLILCLKYKAHENLFSRHVYVNSIYCPSKASMKQRLIANTQNSRTLKLGKTIFLQNKN